MGRSTRIGLLTIVIATLCIASACARGFVPPRNARESFHRDYPMCRGRDIGGDFLAPGQYRMYGCGYEGMYVCPTGPHSNWRTCQRVQ